MSPVMNTFNSHATASVGLLLLSLICAQAIPTLSERKALALQRNAENPYATFSSAAVDEHHRGGCYNPPAIERLRVSALAGKQRLTFTDKELQAAASANVDIDWRKHGAVGPVQQQHPFGTCWAFSMTAVTEAVNVIQGKNKFQKLSEQMVVSCVPPSACGDNADVLWSWALHHTGGRYQTEESYPYNRTCNFFREEQMAPDGTPDGYPGICPPKGVPCTFGTCPCPACPGVARTDGTPACSIDKSRGFSTASIQGWGFIGPHGVESVGSEPALGDVTRMVAALQKYGPAQIGIDASCVSGYTGGIITNCTSRNVDHAVAIVGAGTDSKIGVDYWIVRNSWNTTFGEDGYFRVQRDTAQMGIFGGYFACYEKDCMVDPVVEEI